MYPIIKNIHMLCALLSITGFTIRGIWMLMDSPLLQQRWAKIAPHIIDTVLLASALALAFMSHQYPFVSSWVTAKVIALLVYIGLGMVTLRFGRNKTERFCAFILSILTFCYIVLVARSHNALFFLH